MRRGLVCGKFWPPHLGHKYLVDYASQNCDELTIMVIQKSSEKPSGWLRYRWMQEMYPQATVVLTNDDVKDESPAWAAKTERIIGVPDVVFSSEEYGITWAEAMGCEHEMVDLDRVKVPISGTEVRLKPLTHWNLLTTPAKEWFAHRVVIVGAESTGKTELSKFLAKHYGALMVPEWARLYGEDKGYGPDDWENDDKLFDLIGVNQPDMENAVSRLSNGLVICDTDLLATQIWHETYVGHESETLELYHGFQRGRHGYYLYILTNHDTPWVQDGGRNRGDDDPNNVGSRPWFTRRFTEELTKRGENFSFISGTWEERQQAAIAAIDEFIEGK